MKMLNFIRRPFKYSFNNVSLIIIGVNIAVYLLTSMFPRLKSILSLNVINVIYHKAFWQFFTYMFVHGNFSHILFNMLGILFFGITVERSIGSKEFLLLYFVSGVLCGIFSFAFYYFLGYHFVFLMGASGAIYALLLAYAVIFPRSQIYIMGIIPVQAPLLIAGYAGLAIASQLFGINGGVAHMTHLAGFAVAWLYFLVRMGMNPWKIWKNTF